MTRPRPSPARPPRFAIRPQHAGHRLTTRYPGQAGSRQLSGTPLVNALQLQCSPSLHLTLGLGAILVCLIITRGSVLQFLADLIRDYPWLLPVIVVAAIIIALIAVLRGGGVKTPLGEIHGREPKEPKPPEPPASVAVSPTQTVTQNLVQTVNVINQVASPTNEQLDLLADKLAERMKAREAVEGPAPLAPVAGSPKEPQWWHGAKYVVEKKLYVNGWGYGVLKSVDYLDWRIVATQGLNKQGVIDDNLANDILEFIVFSRGLERGHVFTDEQLEAMQKLTGFLFSKLAVIPSGPEAKY
jgi:hypothetical protein